MELQTKHDYQRALCSMLEPLLSHASKKGARISLQGGGTTYSEDVRQMEAFARPLWGLVPFWMGGGRHEAFERLYQQGIVAGTDPSSEEYWGDCSDNDQRFVEMAPLAFAMLLAPHVCWDLYSSEEKQKIATWLFQINEHVLPRCNWYFFRILVNLALKQHGYSYSGDLLISDLDFIDSNYLGDGWYVDGASNQKDYYCAFAMHFYALVYSFVAKDDETRCERFRTRAIEFSKEFLYWFSSGGEALVYGRSLTYRFAQVAFWSMAMLVDLPIFSYGVVKGVVGRNMRYWYDQSIFQSDGILSVGYTYPNLAMAEKYNAPGSPYWAAKAFAVLALPDSHPYWEVREEPLPVLEIIHVQQKADMLIQHRGWDVTSYPIAVYNRNVLGHFIEKYAKFAYSSYFGFSVAHSVESLKENAPDSMLSFLVDERVFVRRRCNFANIDASCVHTTWKPCPEIEVETWIYPSVTGHLRRHHVKSTIACTAFDAGFSVSQCGERFSIHETEESVVIQEGKHGCKVSSQTANKGKPFVIDADPNTNLLFKKAKIPSIEYSIPIGECDFETQIEVF